MRTKHTTLALLLCAALFSIAPAAHASALTPAQTQAVLNMLASFNADQATVTNVAGVLAASSSWPAAPGALTLDGEMAPFIAAAGPTAAGWLSGDRLGTFLYGSQAQTILHGTNQVGVSENPAGHQGVSCAAVASLGDLGVILVGGQSNCANCAQADASGNFYTTTSPVYNLNIDDGRCYVAKEPLLGANGAGQAFALPLADKLIAASVYRAVLLVPVGVSGTFIEQWRPTTGNLFSRFSTAVADLRQVGLSPSFILWHQGEANAGEYISSGTPDGTHITISSDIALAGTLNWMRDFFEIVSSLRGMGVSAPVFPAVATLCGANLTSNVIQLAQTSVVDPAWGIYAGPNTDALDYSLRRTDDHCHFSSAGNVAHAQAWYNAIASYLSAHPLPTQATLASVTLSVNGQSAVSLPQGGGFSLSWSSANTSSCSGTMRVAGGPVQSWGAVAPNTTGSVQGAAPAGGVTYTLTCTGQTGQTVAQTATVSIVVPPPAVPTCAISITPATIQKGGTATLIYSTQNATSLNIAGVGITGASSGSTTVSPPADATYYATVYGAGGTGQCQTRLTVVPPPPPPTCSISVSPATIPHGGSALLTYSTQNATSLDIAGVGSTGASSGSVVISPPADATYYATAYGAGGTGQCSTLLRVSVLNNPTLAAAAAFVGDYSDAFNGNLAAVMAAPYNILVDVMSDAFVAMGVR